MSKGSITTAAKASQSSLFSSEPGASIIIGDISANDTVGKKMKHQTMLVMSAMVFIYVNCS